MTPGDGLPGGECNHDEQAVIALRLDESQSRAVGRNRHTFQGGQPSVDLQGRGLSAGGHREGQQQAEESSRGAVKVAPHHAFTC